MDAPGSIVEEPSRIELEAHKRVTVVVDSTAARDVVVRNETADAEGVDAPMSTRRCRRGRP